jgi:tripartite-type tricarboxylate transporter receptor subunit TctC
MNRRNAVAAIATFTVALFPCREATAQSPAAARSIRIVVPAPPGGPTDAQARALAIELAKILDASVVVDNKPGAAGLIGSAEVSKARPDGATLLYAPDFVITQSPHTLKKLQFDPFTGLTPIARGSDAPLVLLANMEVPVKSVAELLAYAKANKGQLSFASHGVGTGSHIYGEVLSKKHGLQLIHVPYKGTADAMADFLSNRVQIMFQSPSAIAQFAGKVRVLASAGPARNPLLPDVPTMAEAGFPGFEMGGWVGMFGPGGMSPALVAELNVAINKALQQPAIAAMWKTQGFAVVNEPSAGISGMLKRDHDKWGVYFKDAGIEPQ